MWFIQNFSFIDYGGARRDSCDFSECYYLYDDIQMSKFFLAHFFFLFYSWKRWWNYWNLSKCIIKLINIYLIVCYIQNIEADWVY